MKAICRTTNPNRKLYAGRKPTDCIHYFDSANGNLICKGLCREQRLEAAISKQILREPETALYADLTRRKRECIMMPECYRIRNRTRPVVKG